MQQDLISVIVPCYNVEKFIDDCFKSLENQTYQNIEVIFVNDGSTDKTLDKIKAFCENKKKFRYIDKPNGGLSSARNAGIAEAQGKFIYFLDSDDIIKPNTLQALRENLKITKSDCSVCGIKWIKENHQYKKSNCTNHKPKIFEGSDKIITEYFARRLTFSACNKLYKMSILQKFPTFPDVFDTKIRYSEDVDFNVRYFLQTKKLCFTKSKLYLYRQRKGSIVHSKFNEQKLSVFNGFDKIQPFLAEKTNAFIHFKSHKAVVCLEILFRIIKSDYENKEKIKSVYDDFCENLKFVLKAKRNPFYIKLLPCAKSYIFLSLRKRLKK